MKAVACPGERARAGNSLMSGGLVDDLLDLAAVDAEFSCDGALAVAAWFDSLTVCSTDGAAGARRATLAPASASC